MMNILSVVVLFLALLAAVTPAQGLQVREMAPDFTADVLFANSSFGRVTLSQYRTKSWVLLFFYPLDFTFVCPTEILEFNRLMPEFALTETEVLGISVDSVYTHLAWTKTDKSLGGIGKLSFALVSDLSRAISRAYDVYLYNGPDEGVSLRATVLVDPKGVVRHMQVNDLPVGRNVAELLRLVQAFQFADRNGQVCPSKWQPGGKTIIPDPEGARTFFAADDSQK